jgi:hypothetical protein
MGLKPFIRRHFVGREGGQLKGATDVARLNRCQLFLCTACRKPFDARRRVTLGGAQAGGDHSPAPAEAGRDRDHTQFGLPAPWPAG